MQSPTAIKGIRFLNADNWTGKACVQLMLPFCNLRCPWCNEGDLVLEARSLPSLDWQEVLAAISQKKQDMGLVVFSGGEPMMHRALEGLLRDVKALGLETGVETNGTQPEFVEYLIKQQLLDCVAVDIKADLTDEAYSRAVGVPFPVSLIVEALQKVLALGINATLRTTLVPGAISAEEITALAARLRGFTTWRLSPFVGGKTLDPYFKAETTFSQIQISQLQSQVETLLRS
ncbi:MAG: radical SAM protein [Desulfatibacillaceae bacterium]|nr:radical SAM protein [Desulfatibacillaceae bacterium]